MSLPISTALVALAALIILGVGGVWILRPRPETKAEEEEFTIE